MTLDPVQSAAAAQFDRQSERYGRGHILADTSDGAAATPEENRRRVRDAMRLANENGRITWYWPRLTLLARRQ